MGKLLEQHLKKTIKLYVMLVKILFSEREKKKLLLLYIIIKTNQLYIKTKYFKFKKNYFQIKKNLNGRRRFNHKSRS